MCNTHTEREKDWDRQASGQGRAGRVCAGQANAKETKNVRGKETGRRQREETGPRQRGQQVHRHRHGRVLSKVATAMTVLYGGHQPRVSKFIKIKYIK